MDDYKGKSGWDWPKLAGIYTTTANRDTLDETPEAYKPMADIVRLIEPTAKILFFMVPKMNIKAAEGKSAWR